MEKEQGGAPNIPRVFDHLTRSNRTLVRALYTTIGVVVLLGVLSLSLMYYAVRTLQLGQAANRETTQAGQEQNRELMLLLHEASCSPTK